MQQLTTATSPTVVFLTIISLFHQLALIETVDQIHGINPVAQSSKGNEFYIGFIGNFAKSQVIAELCTALLVVTTDEPEPVMFTAEFFNETRILTATRGQITQIHLPIGKDGDPDVRLKDRDERDKGIRIKAEGAKLLSVFGINCADVSTDAFLALPCHRYPIVKYRYFVFSTDVPGHTYQSRFLMVGCEDNTTVNISPSQIIELPADLTGELVPVVVDPDGSVNTGTFTINRRQTLQLSSIKDLTGTIIESDKPISVFVGHECAQVPENNTACDYVVEQIPPDATWGTQFFTVPLNVRESGERYRIGTVTDNNEVTVTCTTEGQLLREVKKETIRSKQYVEFDTVGDTTDGVTPGYQRDFCCIETTKPAIVMMYVKGHSVDEIVIPEKIGTQGDPSMLFVPPVTQYSNQYYFSTQLEVKTDFLSHISYALPVQFFHNSTSDQIAFIVNGSTFTPTSGYHPIYCSNGQICGYGAYSNITKGFQVVEYTKPLAPLYLYVYGLSREISYAYPAGFLMEPIGVPQIAIYNVTVFENVGTVTIRLNRTGGDLSLRSVIRATSRDVTATAGTDYIAKSDFRIRWFENDVDPRYVQTPTNNDPVFEFTIIDDDIRESEEYFEIDLTLNPMGSGRNGVFFPQAVGRVTILDDEPSIQIGFVPDSYSFDEAAGFASLMITTNNPALFIDATGALFFTTDGTAISSGDESDFTGISLANAITIIFPPGETVTTVSVPISDDLIVETTEQFFGRILSSGGIMGLEIFAPIASINITDNDKIVVTVGFDPVVYSYEEDTGFANLTIRKFTEPLSFMENITVFFSTSDNTALAGSDYSAVRTFPLTLMPDEDTKIVQVMLINNRDIESLESFFGNLVISSDSANFAEVTVPQATVNIIDHFDSLLIGFDPSQYSLVEGEFAMLRIVLDRPYTEEITIFLQTLDGSATDQQDYIGLNATVSFSPGVSEQIVNVSTIDDDDSETRIKYFTAILDNVSPSDVVLINQPNATINITDNDVIRVSFERPNYTVNENNGSVNICVLTSNGHSDSDILVSVQAQMVTAGSREPECVRTDIQTAIANTDFVMDQLLLKFSASVNDDKLCVDVAIIKDFVVEGNEQFVVKFLNVPDEANRVDVGEISQVCVTITDDAPEFIFETPNITISELNGPAEICLISKEAIDTGHSFIATAQTQPKHRAANPATAGFDYESARLILTFMPSEEIPQRQCANVTIIDDSLGNEPDEQFSVSFVSIEPFGMFDLTSVVCVTIIDDDKPLVAWEESEITVNEGEERQICFVVDSGSAVTYKVEVGVRGKGALPATGADYTISSPLTFNIPAIISGGRFCLNMGIIDDSLNENTEQFQLYFAKLDSDYATAGDPEIVCIIIQDNVTLAIAFEKESYSVDESNSTVQVCFLTNIGLALPLEVIIRPVVKVGTDYPASGDSDFSSDSKTVTFPPSPSSEKLCVDVEITNDFVDEYDEQFLVQFVNLPNAQAGLGPISDTCVTIIDDDEPLFDIEPLQQNVSEDEEMVEICVSTNSLLSRSIIVTAETGPKSNATHHATVDVDYENTTLSLIFQPFGGLDNFQKLCGSVTIIDDMFGNEKDEEFSVTLTSATPEGSFGEEQSCITIKDNDIVGITYSTMDLTVDESSGSVTVCLTKNITTDGIVEVLLKAEEKPDIPNKADVTTDFEPRVETIVFQPNQSVACAQVPIKDDSNPESPEIFIVTFSPVNPDIPRPPDQMQIAEVTIVDDDPSPDFIIFCKITEPLSVQTFRKSTKYGFMGTCEHVAVSSCLPIAGFDIQVTVDFITESMDNGAVGLHVNDLHYVSREDGSFDDGSQTPQSSTSTHRDYLLDSGVEVIVDFGLGVTNITFYTGTEISGDSFDLDIQIVHIYDPPAGEDSSIQIGVHTSNSSEIENLCGLCGSRSGDLLKRDGSIADRNDLAQVQEFAQSYLVEPREQILRPQRKECGAIRNDTVIGDPLYAAPVYSEDGKKYSLCYEVYGCTNSTFNLVSDTCVSVNAHYGPMRNHTEGNIINSIGVRAKGLADNSCYNIRVDLTGCSATVQTSSGESHSLASMESFEQDGISVRKYPRRVRISAPNCENVMLVMWVICETRNDEDMIKFVIARGVNLRASSHGLLGQFWNIPMTFTKYNSSLIPEDDYFKHPYYVVTMKPESSPPRSFLGAFYPLKWDGSKEPCLYVGNAQGGPSYTYSDDDPRDSIIEGRYRDYIMKGGSPFETQYAYTKFDEGRC